MTGLFEQIYDIALSHKSKLLTKDEEYQSLMKQVTNMSAEYKNWI